VFKMQMPTWLSSLFNRILRTLYPSSQGSDRDSTIAPTFFYVRHSSLCLRQGEVLYNLYEFKLQIPQSTPFDAEQGVKFDPVEHLYAVVTSQDCDLEQDYKARAGEVPLDKMLSHVLFCSLFPQDEIRYKSGLHTEPMRRVRQNQDERYHYLSQAPVNGTQDMLPELIADFKTTFSLPTEFVYWLLSTSQAARKGALPSPYLEDFMHRLYTFLGRVATP